EDPHLAAVAGLPRAVLHAGPYDLHQVALLELRSRLADLPARPVGGLQDVDLLAEPADLLALAGDLLLVVAEGVPLGVVEALELSSLLPALRELVGQLVDQRFLLAAAGCQALVVARVVAPVVALVVAPGVALVEAFVVALVEDLPVGLAGEARLLDELE